MRKPDGLVMVELCAGCAQLSSSFKKIGFGTLPFDNAHNRRITRVAVFVLNLAEPGSFGILREIMLTETVVYVHMAPPCGTASRARGRPIPLSLKR